MFYRREIEKTYYAVVRGWTAESGEIDSPLSEEGKPEVPARTRFGRIGSAELPWPGSRFPASRYSLVRVVPETGRFHQIRRHLRRLNHPIVGDPVHGDGVHNRNWRSAIGRPYLFLKAHSLSFRNPFDGTDFSVASRWNPEWLKAFDLLGVCPRDP
jgi:tRNA pseudouridine65 synthase